VISAHTLYLFSLEYCNNSTRVYDLGTLQYSICDLSDRLYSII
jgi:hypothetical protein